MLLATDAAGEGLNLQVAHLMVNYDLPWNPNRIEQRFGRIHRIGQTEVCRLWNLVADEHPRGRRVHAAAGQDRGAAQGLRRQGVRRARHSVRRAPAADAADRRDPLRRAARVKAKMEKVIDDRVGEGLDELLAERALYHDLLTAADMAQLRR